MQHPSLIPIPLPVESPMTESDFTHNMHCHAAGAHRLQAINDYDAGSLDAVQRHAERARYHAAASQMMMTTFHNS